MMRDRDINKDIISAKKPEFNYFSTNKKMWAWSVALRPPMLPLLYRGWKITEFTF